MIRAQEIETVSKFVTKLCVEYCDFFFSRTRCIDINPCDLDWKDHAQQKCILHSPAANEDTVSDEWAVSKFCKRVKMCPCEMSLCCREIGMLKPCPHCRRKVRLSPNSATVAVFSPFSVTVALFCDSGQGLILHGKRHVGIELGGMPWSRNARSAYISLEHDDSVVLTWQLVCHLWRRR